jgi:hypothetical protein
MKEKAVGKLRRFGAGSSRFPIPRFSAAVAGFVAERDGKPEARWGRPKGRAERRLSPGVIAAPLSGSSRSHCSGANLQEFFPAQRGIESVIPHPLAESLFIFYNGQRKKSAVTAEVLSVSFRWSWSVRNFRRDPEGGEMDGALLAAGLAKRSRVEEVACCIDRAPVNG